MTKSRSLLTKPEFPRASRYDPDFVLDNQMGPNALWLVEWLTSSMQLKPGMRVLDLGCGRGMTSVFLAKEFGVRVWGADLWIGPDHNWRRAVTAQVSDLICPMRAEAHALPFAKGFFDAVVSIDAYQYFGTDELYLGYLSGFVRQGGQLGVVVPGLTQAIEGDVPSHLLAPQANGKVFWEDECTSFRTAQWWSALWRRCSKVTAVQADTMPDGWLHWRDFERALELAGKNVFPSDVEALDRDQGQYMGMVRILAERTDKEAVNLYDTSVGVTVGVDI